MYKNFTLLQKCLLTAFFLILFVFNSPLHAIDPETLPEVGYHPGGISYWSTPYFSNAVYYGFRWLEYADGQWGTGVAHWNNPQFDVNGYPQYLNPGLRLRAICYALHSTYGSSRPATWPVRSGLAEGHIVLTWQGEADIRLHGGTFIPGESSGAETGSLVDGRRVYLFSGGSYLEWLNVYDINGSDPITDIKVWLADPVNPATSSLEGQVFHPTFLERLQDIDWGFIRFMDFLTTNANPQQDWTDRRPPAHCFMNGTLNPRSPATGSPGNRDSGMAYEYMSMLCNTANKDMWVCVPHLATDDYVRNLARLIRFGSDGTDPYTSTNPTPVYPPLETGRRVYIEYSNEIWSSGYSFPQGNWAQEQADLLGISKPQFNARRFCQIWNIFNEVFEGSDRLVKVAAVFTAAEWYTGPFLSEMATYGAGLVPPVEPDVIAVTTYFGNGIQDWTYDRSLENAGGADPWFFTGTYFDAGGGNMRPVSLPASDPYWLSPEFEGHKLEAFIEWKRRMLSGDAREGAGPDAVGIGGGFSTWLKDLADTTFTSPKPVIAYEGGPSIYTDNRDGGDSRDDGLTIFMEAMNRRPEMAEVYRIHLNMSKSKGLWSHVAFTDCGSWGKYGQWGHLEHLDQAPGSSVKHQFIIDWATEQNGLNHVDNPTGNVPVFDTAHFLPVAIAGTGYSTDITVSGGDGALAVDLIGESFQPGLSYDPLPGTPNSVRVQGTALDSGLSYIYLRVVDADGDPAWRTFTVKAVGGPGTIVETDFTGTDPAQNLPWPNYYVKHDDLTYPGIDKGSGVYSQSGDNALVWSVNAPADEVDSTLALAITDNEYLSVTVQPQSGYFLDISGAELRFTIRRIDYHSPRRYAVFTGIDGFTEGAQVFDSDRNGDTDDMEYRFNFPDTVPYSEITGPLEVRIYGYSGQYGGHDTSLVSFKMNGAINPVGSEVNGWDNSK